MAYLNKMLDRGKRRKQFESFVLNADLNSGVDKTKTSENQRLITPPVIQSNSNDCISQFSTRSITRRLTSLITGTVPRKTVSFLPERNSVSWSNLTSNHKTFRGTLD